MDSQKYWPGTTLIIILQKGFALRSSQNTETPKDYEVIGRWTKESKQGTGTLGLPPINGVKSGLMKGAGRLFMGNPKRARSWKRRMQPKGDLIMIEPLLYPGLSLVCNGF